MQRAWGRLVAVGQMATFQISVLGPVGVTRDGVDVELGDRLRRLLGALVTASGSVVSTDRLADIVWAGDPPNGAAKTLRSYMTRLRKSIGADRDDVIVHRQPGYAIVLGPDELDSSVFEREVDEAARRLRTGDASEARALLASAIGRWRGRAFAGFADEEWARPESVRLEERLVETRELLLDALLAEGDDERAVAEAQALVEAEPLRERPRSALMRALYASGRQAEALRAADAYRQHLADETGLDPSVEFVELESRVVRGDRALGGPVEHLRGYELAERIGEGAFAVVHRGVQPGLERDVAIKIIRPELADRPDFIRRFDVEARTIARIEHPNVVPLFDYWREPGAAYLVMRLLRGGTVEAALRARGPYGREQAVALLDDVGAALAEAHRLGVIHRDVRPANLLLDEQGTGYLADFGIALPTSTSDDLPIVSPAYAAPEVLRGEPAGVAADVLSLGVTVFELLTGRLPFADSHDRAELIRRQMSEPLPPVRATRTDLPARLDEVLARATAKAAADRHHSVAALVDDLRQALAGDSAWTPLTVGTADGPAANPYVGLLAFDEMDADRFFGRSAVVAEVVETMVEHPMVTVVGPSGAGKSSIVRAGVLPAIRRGGIVGSDRWFVTTMLPGRDPVEALEAALLRVAVNPPASLREQLAEDGGLLRAVRRVLPDDETRILLVVDQFEELFTQVTDLGERDRFLSELAAAVLAPGSPLRIVATLRADHYDAPLRHRAMAQLVTAGVVSVHPMSPAELERAIAGPAEQVGVTVEPALVAELVAEVDGHPAALPLLQFSLTELFDRRVAGVMQLSTHRDLGGITGALAARADRIVESGVSADEAEIRRIFGRLVTLGEGTEDTRRRAVRSELGDGERTAWLVDKFVTARLLATDHDDSSREPTVEVAHEALLRDWPRLRGWLADDRADLAVLRTVTDHAAAWEASGRDDGELARGGRLELATDLADRRPDWLTDREREWVAASRAAAEREREAEIAAAERDRRQNRRLRELLVAAACLLVLAVIAVAVALVLRDRSVDSERAAAASRDLALTNERAAEDARSEAEQNAQEAERNAREAEDNAREAEANALAAEAAREDAEIERLVALSAAEIDTAPDRAILLALEANRRRDDIATQTAIHRTIAADPRIVGWFPDPLGEIGARRFSADGTIGVTAAFASGRATWFDVATGEPAGEVYTAPAGIGKIAFSGDGEIAAVGRVDRTVSFADRSGASVGPPVEFDLPIGWIGLDGDGDRAVVNILQDVGSSVVILDVASGTVVSTYEPVADDAVVVFRAEMTEDGTRAVLSVTAAALTFEPFEAVDIVDVSTGELLNRQVVTERGFVSAMSVDGNERVITGQDDGSVVVIRLDGSGTAVAFAAHRSQVTAVVGTRDGVISAARGTVRFWSADGQPIDEPVELPAAVGEMAVRADGRIAAGQRSSGHALIDPGRGALVRATRPVECYSQLMPERDTFDTPGPDFDLQSVILVDLATGDVAREIDVSEVLPNGLSTAPFYSPDGSWMVLIDQPAGIFLLVEVEGDETDVVHGDELYAALFGEHDVSSVFSVRPSADGRRLFYQAESGGRPRAAWFDVHSGAVEAGPLDLDFLGVPLVLSDGRVVAGWEDGVVAILPADLSSEPVMVDGTQGMRPWHQDPATGAVLLGGFAGEVGVLDPDDGSVDFYEGAEGVIEGGAFSPDGSRVAVVSPEAGVHVFDRATGSLLGVPMSLGEVNECIGPGMRWAPDESAVWAITSPDPTLFSADPDDWRRAACDIVHRELTANEWRTFVSPTTDPVPACPDE